MPSATDRPADHRPYVFVSYASADRERIMPLVGAMRAFWTLLRRLRIVLEYPASRQRKSCCST